MFHSLRSNIAFLVLIALQLALSSRAQAYVIAGSAWSGTPVTLTYSYVNMFNGGLKLPDGTPLPNDVIRGSIEESLRLWSNYAPLHFVEAVDDGFDHFGRIRFRHQYINGPDPAPPADPIAKAQATCIGMGSFCEVQFDNGDPWQPVGTLPQPDILGAAIHEVGHILGLHHTSVSGANMYWIFHRFQGIGTGELFPDDIAGIRAMYGTGVGSVTPLVVPEPTSLALLWVASATWLRRRSR